MQMLVSEVEGRELNGAPDAHAQHTRVHAAEQAQRAVLGHNRLEDNDLEHAHGTLLRIYT